MTSADATILVVDDHVPNLAFLTDALSAAGYRVLVATDGQEALDRLALARPDLILLDALMPVLDGFDTCRRLKATPAYESIPVIFMTALGEPEQIVQGLSLGAVDYVTKPAHPEVRRVSPPISGPRARSRSRARRSCAAASCRSQSTWMAPSCAPPPRRAHGSPATTSQAPISPAGSKPSANRGALAPRSCAAVGSARFT
jgi:CheY-like chemotaxis protein